MPKTIIEVKGVKVVEIEHVDIKVAADELDENGDTVLIPLHEYIDSQIRSNMMFDGVALEETRAYIKED